MVYNRGCTIGGGKTDFCLSQYIRDPEVKCHLCEEDRCNDGSVSRIAKFLMAVSSILAIISGYFGHVIAI